MKKYLLLVLLIITVIALSVVRTFVLNNISTSGVQLGQIQDELDTLQTENAVLAEQVYSYSSLTNISSKAAEMGFVNQGNQFVLTAPVPVAYNQ